jgi:DNA-binding MarR family transcriptional regulator
VAVRKAPKTDAGSPSAGGRWLEPEQLEAWRALIVLTQLLPGALDRQLQADAGLAHSDYAVLATLSAEPSHRMRMSDLASTMDYSQSRLSHAMNRIEKLGWVERVPCESDKRVFYAVLTEMGRSVLERAAPGHVSQVRRLVFDHLTQNQVRQLRRIAEQILPQLIEGACGSNARVTGRA